METYNSQAPPVFTAARQESSLDPDPVIMISLHNSYNHWNLKVIDYTYRR